MPAKPKSLEDAKSWIKDNCPTYEIIEWGGKWNKICTIKNNQTGGLCRYSFSQFKNYIKNGRKLAISLSSDVAQKWLDDNLPNIKILKWNGSSEESIFFDETRNIKFNFPFKWIKYYSTKKDNKGTFRLNDKERINTQRQNTIKSGQAILVDNLTLSQWASCLGVSVSGISKLYKEGGADFVRNYSPNKTLPELQMERILNEIYLTAYDYDKKPHRLPVDQNYRGDFLFEDLNLIIECDGVFYHNEKGKNKNYHYKKKTVYEKAGYVSLFFNSYEIKEKPNIIKSIINNKIGKSKRVYARKCTIIDNIESSFFEENHLMGKGQGRIYGLKYDNKIISAIQVKWKNKETKEIEVSRFCHSLNYNVIGGFSRLISYVIKKEKPKSIITFIDKRYGNGEYLKKLQWKKVNEDISFMWTKNDKTYHRMQFPGSSGYKYGMKKLYDCGQAKWILTL